MSTLGVVVAEFYPELAAEMLALARDRADERDATVAEVCRVPGVLDASLPADRLARRDDIDAVVVLGSVVAGDTDHDQVVAHTAARTLDEVSLRRDTPVAFGVTGPDMSAAEARERVDTAAEAVDAAVETLAALPAA
jgi:6,7-dimethyl-8-ribityllumazine synthase